MNVNRVGEKIQVSVRLIATLRGMTMRRKPCHGSPFDKAWVESRVLEHRANAGRSIGRGPRTPWKLFLLLVPGAVVPLPDEAAPILNGQLNRMVAHAE